MLKLSHDVNEQFNPNEGGGVRTEKVMRDSLITQREGHQPNFHIQNGSLQIWKIVRMLKIVRILKIVWMLRTVRILRIVNKRQETDQSPH